MKRISLTIVFFIMSFLVISAAAIERPKMRDEQRTWEERNDLRNIRHAGPTMITDETERFLDVPASYGDARDFEVAETPPRVDFAIIQDLEPEYLPYHLAKNTGGAWGGWGDVTKGPDGRFYFSISNHMSYGAESYIIAYDPATKRHEIVLSAKDACGWQPNDFGDGKIHGDIDFGPGGDTWVLTYFGPVPKEKEWNTVYRGSWLLRYNCFSGETECLGIPLEGASWPYHNYDGARGLLFSVSHTGNDVIAYDTRARRMVYGGSPPDGIRWYARCILMDRGTGDIYTTDSNDDERHFIRYSRRNNTFTRMEATTPVNPVTVKRGDCRAHTSKRAADGGYWCLDHQGTVFRFFPDEDRTEYAGINWGDDGVYTANISMSPGGRYLYYVPGQLSEMPAGTPVVQYDTVTGKKKALGFIFDHYMEKYGYAPVRCYGIEIDEKGESLVFFANGGFATPEDDKPYGIKMRRPAVFQFHIPAGEREE